MEFVRVAALSAALFASVVVTNAVGQETTPALVAAVRDRRAHEVCDRLLTDAGSRPARSHARSRTSRRWR